MLAILLYQGEDTLSNFSFIGCFDSNGNKKEGWSVDLAVGEVPNLIIFVTHKSHVHDFG